jgi:hypothetical protein
MQQVQVLVKGPFHLNIAYHDKAVIKLQRREHENSVQSGGFLQLRTGAGG